ncbi:MAG: hypothetical protein JSR45_09650 [Proteobacteria bacterium]|nr:hypothetical protein [Pseudomonadota bacterium]
MASDDFHAIYAELRARMLRAAAAMQVAKDEPSALVLHAPWPHPHHPKQAMWFGGVEIRKSYVSYHLMPVYGRPALLDGVSSELRRRMQGKACFNFKAADPALFDELEALTAKGAELFAKPLSLAQITGA